MQQASASSSSRRRPSTRAEVRDYPLAHRVTVSRRMG
jgi:hypothetical protein